MSHDLEDRYARLSLNEEEKGGLVLEEIAEDEGLEVFKWCLVGHFLTDNTMDFIAMCNMMSSFWWPIKGICIKELNPNLFLFQFFHELDLKRVISSGP